MVSSVGITKRSRPVGTYDKGGWEMEVYDDPIPLEMKDLRDAGLSLIHILIKRSYIPFSPFYFILFFTFFHFPRQLFRRRGHLPF